MESSTGLGEDPKEPSSGSTEEDNGGRGSYRASVRAVCSTVYAKYAAYSGQGSGDEEVADQSESQKDKSQESSKKKKQQQLRFQQAAETRKSQASILATDDLDDETFHQSRPGYRSQPSKSTAASSTEDSPELDSSWTAYSNSIRNPVSRMASLDFERVVNHYSIEAAKRRFGLETERSVRLKAKQQNSEETTPMVAAGGGANYSATTSDGTASPFINKQAAEKAKQTHIRHRNHGRSATKWILTCLTGLLTGLVTTQIVHFSEILVMYRLEYISSMEETAVSNAWNKALSQEEGYSGGVGDDIEQSTLVDFVAEAEGQGIENATHTQTTSQHQLSFEERVNRSYEKFLRWGYASIFVQSTLFNILLALTSSAMCLFLAPEAVGSGIPEMKAYLNGVRVRRFTNLKLFFVKIVGTILSVSSGLAIGPEGPLVHLGAVLGASLTKTQLIEIPLRHCCGWWAGSLLDAISFRLSYFHNDDERRDLITMGAASGFAAAFGAPIGGVLFGMEEASTYFPTSLLFKTLTATTIATFCMAFYRGDLSQYSVISFETEPTPNDNVFEDSIAQLPLYVVIGVVGGLLGAFFNSSWKWMSKKRQAFFTTTAMGRNHKIAWKLFEVAVVSAVTSAIIFILPLVLPFACTAEDEDHSGEEIIYRRFDCPEGSVNELASLLFGSREDAIKEILHHAERFDPRTLAIVGLLFYPLMILTFGVSLPSGIFMPTVLTGSALGGAAGILLEKVFGPNVAPAEFGLLGAAALLAGIQRTPVSLCVILAEGTGQTKYLLPVIVTTVMARYIGDFFSDGIYEIAINLREYPCLEQDVPAIYDVLPVKEIMHRPPTVLKGLETAGKIEDVLLETPYQGFPVVDTKTGKFVGLVRRDQLVALLECGIFATSASSSAWASASHSDELGDLQMRAAFHTRNDPYGSLVSDALVEEPRLSDDHFDGHSWFVDNVRRSDERVTFGADDTLPSGTLKRYKRVIVALEDGKLVVFVSPADQDRLVDVASVMNQGAYCVTETTPVSKAYQVFTKLGLRHLCVLGGESGGQVVGMITRSNLDHHYIAHHMGKEE